MAGPYCIGMTVTLGLSVMRAGPLAAQSRLDDRASLVDLNARPGDRRGRIMGVK